MFIALAIALLVVNEDGTPGAVVAEMLSRGEQGSIVTLICDGAERYAATYYNDDWVAEQGLELASHTDALETFLTSGAFPTPRRRDPRPR